MSVNETLIIMSKLTLSEKVALLIGKDNWSIKYVLNTNLRPIVMADGPNGLRKEMPNKIDEFMMPSNKAVCYPSIALLASSFNPVIVYNVANSIAKEAVYQGVDLLLAPGANIKRNPLCGRNFEYFSEDPFLSYRMASAYIDGVQQTGIGATLKHFVANSQEDYRMVCNALIDDRTLHEVYLNQFKRIIKRTNPVGLMTAYNLVNGSYVCESDLLKKEIRTDLDYHGLVMTDWHGMNDRVQSYNHGLDLEMPGGFKQKEITKALKQGLITKETIDQAAKRIIDTTLKLRQSDKDESFDLETARLISKVAALDSMVLLKNDGLLPYEQLKNMTLIGKLSKFPRYQGSGSSRVNPHDVETLYGLYLKKGYQFDYADGYEIDSEVIDELLIEEAISKSKGKDLVLVVLGLTELYESEGFDRTHINLPANQLALIKRLSETVKNVAVIIESGSVVSLPFNESVSAILLSYFSGEAGASALFEIITGKVSPSGRLAETFIDNLDELESTKHYSKADETYHKEGIFIGYKDTETFDKKVKYPFGFGLSYTTFEYQKTKFEHDSVNQTITFDTLVTNKGKINSSEVIQVYMGMTGSNVYREKKRLVGFQKMLIESTTNENIGVRVSYEDLMVYDTFKNEMVLEDGLYTFYIGRSVKDIIDTIEIKLTGQVIINNIKAYDINMDLNTFSTYFSEGIKHVTKNRVYDLNSTFTDVKDLFLGKILIKFAKKKINRMAVDDVTKHMMIQSFMMMPMRTLESSTRGHFNRKKIDGFLLIFNKKRVRGFLKLIYG